MSFVSRWTLRFSLRIAGRVAYLRPRLWRGDRTGWDRRTAGANSYCV